MFKAKLIAALAAATVLMCGATDSEAGVIRSPVAVSLDAGGEFTPGDILNTFNQSGLTPGFVSGVTDFDTYIGGDPRHTIIYVGFEWFTAPGNTTAQLTYDLGAAFIVTRMAFWNDEFSGSTNIDVSVSTDGVGFTTVGTGFNPTNWATTVPDYGADVFSLTPLGARFVRLNISECPQPAALYAGCSMGEIAFETFNIDIPEPATLGLFGLGLAGLGLARRRKAS